ncbi:hypothetical protein [Streptomyces sp. ISL-36]|uniref:hypothetical protein n=1 Tax=Streptomyces sp. ISL-36 TaxID=2819182 RepID=UPI0027E49C9E|nr:hypothetical protein [Streptomyces sp. ISL-36]
MGGDDGIVPAGEVEIGLGQPVSGVVGGDGRPQAIHAQFQVGVVLDSRDRCAMVTIAATAA